MAEDMPTNWWLRGFVLFVLVAAIAGFYLLGWYEYLSWVNVRAHVDDLQARADENLVLAAAVCFGIYVILAALSVPAAWMLSVVAGALFGRFLGAAIAVTAATIGATFAFWSSRFLLRDWVNARFGESAEAFNRGFERDGACYLFSLRLVPIVPFFLINLGMGLTPISAFTFVWVTLIGMLPGAFLYANAGSELGKIESPRDVLSPGIIISLALLGIAPLVFRKALQWIQTSHPGDEKAG